VGEHDFASFVTERSPDKDTVRLVRRLDITSSGRYVFIEIEGNGFLYNMVRTIAGCLMAVGRGLRPVGWMKEVLDARDRTRAFETAPARGLTMVRATY
jgi:tRNA pseudouridine38-40 synthase